MASTTLSIRVPADTRRWLERFTLSRGSTSSAAARVLEEARRHDLFPGVEFRDTPQGRIASIQGTKVAVYFLWLTARDFDFDPAKAAECFHWPLWKAESALAYAKAFPDEITAQVAEHEAADYEALSRTLPGLKLFEAAP